MDLDKGMSSGIRKFDGTEFDVWSTLQEVYLTAKGIWYVIEQEKPEEAAAKRKWEHDNKQAKMALLWSLEHEMVKLVISCETARDIWNRLKAVHAQKSESCRMVLYQEFYASNMAPGQRISDYVAKVEFIAKKLKNSGAPLDDETLISKVVTGLSQDYNHFMTTWMGTPASERTFENLLPRLLAEEAIIKPEQQAGTVAMKMTRDNNSRQGSGSKFNSKGKKKDIVCYNCGEKGHIKRKCPKLNQNTQAKDDSKKFAIMARTGLNQGRDEWLVDSGASEHMTGDGSILDNYKILPKKVPIRVGNNEYVYGVGTGSLKVISTVNNEQLEVTISDVMHVPGISDNLFSAGMADEKGLTIRTGRGRMEIVYQDNIIMVGHKTKGSNLYKLDIQIPARAIVARAERTIDEWHRVLGHPGVAEVQNLQRKGCTQGFKVVEDQRIDRGCSGCQAGKAHQVSHPSSTRSRASELLERVHMDLAGVINPSSIGGKRYFLLIRDEFSTYMHVYFLASKAEVVDFVHRYVNEASIQTQKKVRVIRSDNGSEFRNMAMTQLCQAEGIIQEFSSPQTPEQNGEIERAMRTVSECARAMLIDSGLPSQLWGEAVNTAVFLKNRLTNKRTNDRTPYELFHGKQPDYSHLIEFGKQVHVLDKLHHLAKFQRKTIEAFMVGYGDRINTYRCYAPLKKDVIVSSDVFVAAHKNKTVESQSPTMTFSIESHPFVDDELAIEEPIGQEPDQQVGNGGNCGNLEYANDEPHGDNNNGGYANNAQAHEERANIREQEGLDNGGGNSSDGIVYPDLDEHIQAERASQVREADDAPVYADVETPPVPPPRQQSLTPPQPQLLAPNNQAQGGTIPIWRPSANFEDRARTSCVPAPTNRSTTREGNIVLPAPRPPNVIRPEPASGGTRQVGSLSPRSLINRLRPALGITKRVSPGEDSRNLIATVGANIEPRTYQEALTCADSDKWKVAIAEELAAHADNETWELVPKQAHTREITAKWIFKVKDDAESKRFKARLVARGFSQQEGTDYNDIFAPVVRMDSVRLLFSLAAQLGLKWRQFDITTAFLNGEVSEELYLTPPEGLSVSEGYTCRLKRSLYGLKQAPRCWNAKFTSMLKQFGMRPTLSDPCVYVTQGEPIIYLGLYVDDGLVFSKTDRDIDTLIAFLTKHFKVKVINSACFLGLEIKEVSDGSIFLHQKRYINRMLLNYNMTDCKSKPTPLEAGHALNKVETLDNPIIEGVPYAELVGSLLYCSVATRPDISYPLSVLSKYTSQPREAHWQALKRVLRYLSGTSDYGLLFARREHPKLECFTDADYAGDHQNRRSTSGMATFLTSGPISYKAQQQSTVALSTTEAEYIAAAIAAKELAWLRRFLIELHVKLKSTPEMLCDNQSALRLIRNPEFHQRTKHIDVAFHFVRDKYEEGLFVLKYVSSEEQKADIFTKAFTASRFQDLRNAIGCVRIEGSSS